MGAVSHYVFDEAPEVETIRRRLEARVGEGVALVDGVLRCPVVGASVGLTVEGRTVEVTYHLLEPPYFRAQLDAVLHGLGAEGPVATWGVDTDRSWASFSRMERVRERWRGVANIIGRG